MEFWEEREGGRAEGGVDREINRLEKMRGRVGISVSLLYLII